jgi:hypothetical protein
MAKQLAALVIYLEDNERWIATRVLRFHESTLIQHTEREISERLPDSVAHPFRYDSFVGLADAVAVIQDKLRDKVSPWVPCETVMIGVDLELFYPQRPNRLLRTNTLSLITKRSLCIMEGESIHRTRNQNLMQGCGADQAKRLSVPFG